MAGLSSAATTTITATARLSRELTWRFDRQQLAAGKLAWERADVLPYPAWLKRLWRDLAEALPQAPLLLNEAQLAAAWEGIIRDDIARRAHPTEPLWNTHASAKISVDAWRILNDWEIDLDECAKSHQPDHRCWVRWARRFEELCAERNWMDAHRLASRITAVAAGAQSAALAEQLTGQLTGQYKFVGFDQMLPGQQSLLDALRHIGVEIEVVPAAESVNRKVEYRVYADEAEQWLHAARWARDTLWRDPQARLAVVAPDLAASSPAIEYALKQILSPRQLADPGPSAQLPYHLSLGKTLIHHPVAKAALDALTPMDDKPLPFDSINGLIGSPFLRGADGEALARSMLAQWCRSQLPPRIRFRRFVRELSTSQVPHCPTLIEALNAVLPLLPDGGGRQLGSHWSRHFGDWLERIGWPGERSLDSDEFQVARAFNRQLRGLASLDLSAAPMSAAAALSWLRRRLAEQPFQVEAHDAPVQVLGVLEAAGQCFDGVWFGGLTETDWPLQQRPNPFIAVGLQRQVGVPAASLTHNRELAAEQQRRLIACAGEIVLSRARMDGDVPLESSALFDDAAASWNGDGNGRDADDPPPANLLHEHKPELETFVDTRGPAFAQGGAARGGIAVIENQAKCPFRAFAIHRLGARDIEQNEQGLAAGERGALIHRALQLAWGEIQSSQRLGEISPEQLRGIIDQAAERAGQRHQAASGCGERFQATQTRWASDTLDEWFAVEKLRAAPFAVHALEEKFTLCLCGLELTFKADRIDRMADGALALIDYKTGTPSSLANWLGERPQSPQLPLYVLAVLAQEAPVEIVAFGWVKRGGCGFSGIARSGGFDHPGTSPNRVSPPAQSHALKRDFADWDELLAHWRTVLARLAGEFLDGEAGVDPLNPSVCAQCGLHALCRIEEDSDSEARETAR